MPDPIVGEGWEDLVTLHWFRLTIVLLLAFTALVVLLLVVV